MKSSEVFVFPCVSRSTVDEQENLNAKLMSEKNITNIIKSITDNESYVISWDTNKLKCVIDGYYFELELDKAGTKYAAVCMKPTGNDIQIIEGDDNNNFAGLAVTETYSDGALALCIDGVVPAESYFKFKPESLGFNTIDCGELN